MDHKKHDIVTNTEQHSHMDTVSGLTPEFLFGWTKTTEVPLNTNPSFGLGSKWQAAPGKTL